MFHIGDIVSVTTGVLVAPRGINAMYDILDYMTNDHNFTHQLPRVAKECAPELLRQHPQLAEIESHGIGRDNWQPWLAAIEAKYGEMLPVKPMASVLHVHQNPVSELVENMGVNPDKVIVAKL